MLRFKIVEQKSGSVEEFIEELQEEANQDGGWQVAGFAVNRKNTFSVLLQRTELQDRSLSLEVKTS